MTREDKQRSEQTDKKQVFPYIFQEADMNGTQCLDIHQF